MSKGIPDGLRSALYWVVGLASIALILLIMLILFGNLSGNVGFGSDTLSFTNETITLSTAGGTPASASGLVNSALSSVVITNATGGETIASGNYTVTGVVITNATGTYGGQSVNVSATVTYDSTGKVNTDTTIANYTTSATNITENFPTVGTILGVAILLVILLGVLIYAISKMMKVAGTGGGSYSGNSKFGGNSSAEFA